MPGTTERVAWIQAAAATLSAIAALVLLFIIRAQTATMQRQTRIIEAQQRYTQEQQTFARKQQARWRLEERYAGFNAAPMMAARARTCQLYGKPSPEILDIFNVFEAIGGDCRRGYADVIDADYFFREPILLYWYGWQDWMMTMRRHDADPNLFADYEFLVKELLTRTSARPPSEPQLRAWAEREIETAEFLAMRERALQH